jgi:hypothetical protein
MSQKHHRRCLQPYLRGFGRVPAGRLFHIATVLKALRPMMKGEVTCLEAGNDD